MDISTKETNPKYPFCWPAELSEKCFFPHNFNLSRSICSLRYPRTAFDRRPAVVRYAVVMHATGNALSITASRIERTIANMNDEFRLETNNRWRMMWISYGRSEWRMCVPSYVCTSSLGDVVVYSVFLFVLFFFYFLLCLCACFALNSWSKKWKRI